MISGVVRVNLEKLLEEKGVSLYAVAKETGVSYNTLSRIKNNKVTSMSFDVLEKICAALDCTPNDLLLLEK